MSYLCDRILQYQTIIILKYYEYKICLNFCIRCRVLLCLICQGKTNKNFFLSLAPEICEIKRKLKQNKCIYFIIPKCSLKMLLASKDTQKNSVRDNFHKWLHNYSEISSQAL